MSRPPEILRSLPAPAQRALPPFAVHPPVPSSVASPPPAPAIHVRIGRIVIDGGALDHRGDLGGMGGATSAGGAATSRDLEARLHQALMPLLGDARTRPAPPGHAAGGGHWASVVAADIAARLRPMLGGGTR